MATIKTTSWCLPTSIARIRSMAWTLTKSRCMSMMVGTSLPAKLMPWVTVSKTDADGYVTQYSYTALDLVQKINYNGAKEVSYQYNKVGEAEGDSGELTFQGTRYLNFRREGAE